jgi:Leucine rich repeat
MVSEKADLVANTTTAYQARQWLDQQDDLILCPESSTAVTQRYIMALFYFQLNGDEWYNCRAVTAPVAGSCTDGTPWLDVSHECDWYGVVCDATTQTITKLTLKANNLMGVLPNEVCDLVQLQGLSLDHNLYIGGTIPEGIGKLSQLTYIELDENFLGGSIPTAFYQMTQLQAIDLNGNKLTGTLSESIANLHALSVLQVEDNLLFGQLPSALSTLQDLCTCFS